MKVIEDRGDPSVAQLLEMADIPGRQRSVFLHHYMYFRPEQRGPLVQIFLITELAVLDPRIAPLDAAVLPPAHDFLRFRRPSKGHELNAEATAPAALVVARTVGVLGDEHVLSRLLELPENERR